MVSVAIPEADSRLSSFVIFPQLRAPGNSTFCGNDGVGQDARLVLGRRLPAHAVTLEPQGLEARDVTCRSCADGTGQQPREEANDRKSQHVPRPIAATNSGRSSLAFFAIAARATLLGCGGRLGAGDLVVNATNGARLAAMHQRSAPLAANSLSAGRFPQVPALSSQSRD